MNRRNFIKSSLAALAIAPVATLLPPKYGQAPSGLTLAKLKQARDLFVTSTSGLTSDMMAVNVMYHEREKGVRCLQSQFDPLEMEPGDSILVGKIPAGAEVMNFEVTTEKGVSYIRGTGPEFRIPDPITIDIA